jgi:hypothetical protein
MINRIGYCIICNIDITIKNIDNDLNYNRFYFSENISCPICNRYRIKLEVVE